MGTAISTLRDAVGVSVANPAYVLVGTVLYLLVSIVGLVLGLIPFVGQYLYLVLFMSLLNTGLIGMVYAASELGELRFGALREAIRNKYLTVAGTYAVSTLLVVMTILALWLLVTVGLSVLGVGLGLGSALMAPQSPEGVAAGSIGVAIAAMALMGLVVVLLPVAAFQFVGVAVVVDDLSVGESLKRSVRLLAENPLSVCGYTLLRGALLYGPSIALVAVAVVVGGTSDVPTGTAEAAAATPAAETLGLTILALVLLAGLVHLLVYPVFMAYHTEYYRQVAG